MKKNIWVMGIMIILCVGMVFCATAQEVEKEALSYEELLAWVTPYDAMARETAPLNAPIGEEALTEDGYMYIYDFATLYYDKPQLDSTTVLNAIVVVSESAALVRNVNVDATVTDLLNAFYSENPSLNGTRDFAYLYLSDTMPMGAMWAWVQRNGQDITAVQYAVHEQRAVGGEGYSDCGLIYTIQADTVVALRAYGLNTFVSEEQVQQSLKQVEKIAQEKSYIAYPKSLKGDELEPFERDDLVFSGIDIIGITPEECITAFGEPFDDVWMEDEAAFMRTLTFDGMDITFSYDANKENGKLLVLNIVTPEIEGPRGTVVGTGFSNILLRFRHSQNEYDGSGTEVLYGTIETGDYATAEYSDGGTSTLRYVTTVDGHAITLQMFFQYDVLTEILVYEW